MLYKTCATYSLYQKYTKNRITERLQLARVDGNFQVNISVLFHDSICSIGIALAREKVEAMFIFLTLFSVIFNHLRRNSFLIQAALVQVALVQAGVIPLEDPPSGHCQIHWQ
jgi:hypothetical protein